MNIGEVAQASGVSAKMVRYYEQIGLIPAAQRNESGYRTYSETDMHVLKFIGRARDFGLPMDKIKLLVALWKDRGRASRDVKEMALQHVAELRTKIVELTAMADTLQELADKCSGSERPDCPILKDLAGETDHNHNGTRALAGQGFRAKLSGTEPGRTARAR
jgi:MerR family copper efflux transcriptional regulator